jgi:hypothetical protein
MMTVQMRVIGVISNGCSTCEPTHNAAPSVGTGQ